MAKVNDYVDRNTATAMFLEGLKNRLKDKIIDEGYMELTKAFNEQVQKLHQYAEEVARETIVDITSAQSADSAQFHFNIAINIVKKDNEG